MSALVVERHVAAGTWTACIIDHRPPSSGENGPMVRDGWVLERGALAAVQYRSAPLDLLVSPESRDSTQLQLSIFHRALASELDILIEGWAGFTVPFWIADAPDHDWSRKEMRLRLRTHVYHDFPQIQASLSDGEQLDEETGLLELLALGGDQESAVKTYHRERRLRRERAQSWTPSTGLVFTAETPRSDAVVTLLEQIDHNDWRAEVFVCGARSINAGDVLYRRVTSMTGKVWAGELAEVLEVVTLDR